jgi:glutamyl-tRNA reductase
VSQILGQVRTAYGTAREAGTVGRTLHELVQQALRVGKRVHAETDLDHAGPSVVAEALADAEAVLGTLAGRSALVVGAGAMGGLAVAALRRAGIGSVVIANRTKERGERLANALGEHGIAAEAVGLDDLGPRVAVADLLVACTGSVGAVVRAADVPDRGGRPLAVCDLGLPRDVEPGVAALAGVTVIDLESLQRRLAGSPAALDTRKATELVFEEVRGYLAGQRSAEVTPTVTALRKRAADVVDSELLRLDSRLPGMDERTREELTRTVRRVVDKLLHTPTVRVKQLAADPAGASYADALRELFALDPQAPAVLASTPEGEER